MLLDVKNELLKGVDEFIGKLINIECPTFDEMLCHLN
jgi:hypothetical protein